MRHALIDPADSLLVVIDAQDAFLGKLPAADRQRLVAHLRWLIATAS